MAYIKFRATEAETLHYRIRRIIFKCIGILRMPSSGTSRCVVPVRADVLEENIAIRSSETAVLTGATMRNITEDGILHSQRRENFKSYMSSY
jgi:hypothetical protein